MYWQDGDGNPACLKMPEGLVKTWYHHPIHGASFRKLLDGLTEKFGKPEEVSTRKRGAEGQATPTIMKKPKLDVTAVALDEMPGDETQQAGLQLSL